MEKLKIKTAELALTTLEPHPLLAELGLDNDKEIDDLLDIYCSESSEIGYYDRILATNKNHIIGNLHSWSAMINQGVESCLIDIAQNIEDEEVIRIINAQSLYFRRSYMGKAKLFNKWKEYLTENTKGKEFAAKLEGNKTSEKIASITGYGASTVKMYLSIFNYNNDLLNRIGDEEGQMSLTEAYNKVQENKKSAENENINEEENGSTDNPSDELVDKTGKHSDKKPREIKLKYEPSYINFSFEKRTPKLSYKDGNEVALQQKTLVEAKNKLVLIYQTLDNQTTIEIKILNPVHIRELS